jgi:HTH-type transcriptional regulator, glycine betaine synthesis regulator
MASQLEVRPDAQESLEVAKQTLIQGTGRISAFWGLKEAMGRIYGLLYLTPGALSLDEIADMLGISKGSVSIHIRDLEGMGMVHKIWNVGSRRDYYEAETDFWAIAKGIFKYREKKEFDQALASVKDSLRMVEAADPAHTDPTAQFYRDRLAEMEKFFGTLDQLVDAVQALSELRLSALAELGREAEKP